LYCSVSNKGLQDEKSINQRGSQHKKETHNIQTRTNLFLRFTNRRRNPKFSELAEGELIKKYKESHDIEIPGILFQEYTHIVFGICMKYLSDEDQSKDAVMHIYESVVKDLKIYEVDNFKNWLYKVSKNHCLKIIRRDKQDQRHSEYVKSKSSIDIMEFETTMSQMLDGIEEKKIEYLKEAVEKLKEEQRKCIELFYFEDKSYLDIVDITGYPLSKVKSYVQNGKRNLLIKLRKHKVFRDE